jgi:mRNA interferase YafQ
MLEIKYSSKFKKDYKKIKFSGRFDIKKLENVLKDISFQIPLDSSLDDHQLKGNLSKYRECHIEPDWLLIYKLESTLVIFVRTGSHSELFD